MPDEDAIAVKIKLKITRELAKCNF